MKLVVFTDLDGSLLNHSDYSYFQSRPALQRIASNQVPLVFVTSKTRAEVEILQGEIGIREPFVVENGGGIYFPRPYRGFRISAARSVGSYQLIRFGRTYAQIRRFVVGLQNRFEIRGFGDLSVEEISKLTDLPPAVVALAKRREFTEPFLLADPQDLTEVSRLASHHGLKITRGGRFHHLIGQRQDKGKAVRQVQETFRRNWPGEIVTVGLGDSPNDLPMLEVVDIPVTIPNHQGRYLDLEREQTRKARFPGSKGWNEAVLEILEDVGL